MRHEEELEIIASGDVLIINGESFDFSDLSEGGKLPLESMDSDRFAGPAARIDGVLHINLILPHGAKAPPETSFPAVVTVSKDGPIDLPPYEIIDQEDTGP